MSSGERMVTVRAGRIAVVLHALRRVATYLPPATAATDDMDGAIDLLEELLTQPVTGRCGLMAFDDESSQAADNVAAVDSDTRLAAAAPHLLRACRHGLYLAECIRDAGGMRHTAPDVDGIAEVLRSAIQAAVGGRA